MGVYYKHMSQYFELYMELNRASSDGDSTFKELGTVMNDLLVVLISEQDADGYDQNFFEVWL